MMEDFHEICRTCLEEIETDYKYLFNVEYINEEKLRLSEILTACTSIEVLENDNLPKQVCIKCENNILNAFSFQQLCHKSDSVLKAILSQSDQPQLIELKPLEDNEEASLNSAIQFNNVLCCNTCENDEVNQLLNIVENSKSYLNEALTDHLTSGEKINDGSSLGSNDVNSSEQKHTFCNLNQENDLSCSYQIKEEEPTHKELQTYIEAETLQPLYSLKNENNSSSSYHTESVDSEHIGLKPNNISNKNTCKEDQVNNLDEAGNAQLTSVKILKEDNDYDERNFSAQGDIESVNYSFNQNYKNNLSPDCHIEAQQINSAEDETLQPLFPCEAKGCFACFTTLEDLKDHSKKHLSKCYYCKICDMTFSGANTLSRHMTSKHHPEKKTHLCSHCGKGFARSDDLKRHIQMHTGERPFKCPKCDKRLGYRDSLAMHMKIHTGQKDSVCNLCKKRFTSPRYLAIHKRVHTGERPYSCNTCGKSFLDHSSLNVHCRIHSGEKPYVCTYCGRGCVSSSRLKKHTRIHTGEKPYQCNSCTESFKRSEDLRRHTSKAHTDERNYVCEICHKGFTLKSTLKAHKRIHTDARNHICNICKKGFNQKGTLKAHMRVHTGEKPFTCNVCNKSFSHSGTCWTHMKSHKRTEKLEAVKEITLKVE